MTKLTLRIILGALLLCVASLNASAQIQAGAIKAVRVEGDVQKLLPDGTQVVVTEGELITEKDTLVTGANSSVVLVFMNGSTVQVGATTRMSIDEFKMDPFGEDIEPGKLEKEPSVSRTNLNVAYGEVIGNVKKLSKGSAYNVRTPVGAAGIRGTTFRVALVPITRPDGTTTFNITLSTSAGVVVFTALAPEGVTPTAVEVSAGTEVQADVVLTTTVDATTGASVTTAAATVAPTTEISTAATATINAVAAFVQAAVQAVVITPVEAVAATTAASTKTETPASTPSTTPAPPGAAEAAAAVRAAVAPAPATTETPAATTETAVATTTETPAAKPSTPAPTTTPILVLPPDTRSTSAPPGGE